MHCVAATAYVVAEKKKEHNGSFITSNTYGILIIVRLILHLASPLTYPQAIL